MGCDSSEGEGMKYILIPLKILAAIISGIILFIFAGIMTILVELWNWGSDA